MTEDEIWRHQLSGDEFEQTLGDSEGQESLVCCSTWGSKELDMTQQLNNILGKQFFSNRSCGNRKSENIGRDCLRYQVILPRFLQSWDELFPT